MSILLALAVVIAAAAAALFLLANHWANTPHGRLEPIFALLFRLQPLLDPRGAERGIGAAEMNTPEQTAKVRAEFLARTAWLSRPVAFRGTIEDRRLPGAPGGELPVRVYRPETPEGGGALPLVVYFHGGGFAVGSPVYTDVATRILATKTPALVVSVDYRMAPEHPFPAAVEDGAFALRWCLENAASLGARPGRVAVAGDSAGGNLAAVMAQRERAASGGGVSLQVLIYPWLDLTRMDRASHVAFRSGYGLRTRDLEEFVERYVPPGVDLAHPDLSPLRASSLAGLARACVITAGFDVLRDEGFAYAEALRAAGVEVKHVHEPAMPHGFITMTRLCSEARANLEAVAAEIRASFSNARAA